MRRCLSKNDLDMRWYSIAISLAAQNGTSEAHEIGKGIRGLFYGMDVQEAKRA